MLDGGGAGLGDMPGSLFLTFVSAAPTFARRPVPVGLGLTCGWMIAVADVAERWRMRATTARSLLDFSSASSPTVVVTVCVASP